MLINIKYLDADLTLRALESYLFELEDALENLSKSKKRKPFTSPAEKNLEKWKREKQAVEREIANIKEACASRVNGRFWK